MQGTFVEWMTMLGEWAIAGTILYEGHVALKEYRSARLFDAIKYVEDADARKARTIIYEKLQGTSPKTPSGGRKTAHLKMLQPLPAPDMIFLAR